MNHAVILHQICIENANAMAGFTYGFPAITHLLGYVHALSRKLEPLYGIKLEGCAVICHTHQLHANRQHAWSDYRFNLTRNPLGKDGTPVAFIEEARMHLTLSLIIPCSGLIGGDVQHHDRVCEAIKTQALTQKIAGGRIMDIKGCYSQDFPDEPKDVKSFLRAFVPGFMLVDGFSVLHAHYQQKRETQPESSLLDAWLDFCALSEHSESFPKEKAEKMKDPPEAQWVFKPTTQIGYYVPLMAGYKRISELYPPHSVHNTRDPNTPFCMTQAAFSLGQWLSPTRIRALDSVIWNYHVSDPYYVCRCAPQNNIDVDEFVTLDDD